MVYEKDYSSAKAGKKRAGKGAADEAAEDAPTMSRRELKAALKRQRDELYASANATPLPELEVVRGGAAAPQAITASLSSGFGGLLRGKGFGGGVGGGDMPLFASTANAVLASAAAAAAASTSAAASATITTSSSAVSIGDCGASSPLSEADRQFADAILSGGPVGETATATAAPKVSPNAGLTEEVKMILCVRRDLKMGAGKMCAQCAHAATAAASYCLLPATSAVASAASSSSPASKAERRLRAAHVAWYGQWEERWGTKKIAVGIPDLAALEAAVAGAASIGVPFFVVRDAGRTQVESGTATVVAIGPAPASLVDRITGSFKLL